jgi:hypothetical protein
MPVLVWEITDRGPQSTVETGWQTAFTTEEVRLEAEILDQSLDEVLDQTVDEVQELARADAPIEFVRAWSIGSTLRSSRVLESPSLQNESRQTLWLALARKCRTGVRSDRRLEPRWQELRPSAAREPRREGRKLDYFEMCLWLAEQPFSEAVETFGGSVRNVWQMLERPTLRPLVLRDAFRRWLQERKPEDRDGLLQPQSFAELMKVLRARWPDRGPGSAKRPVHFTDDQLLIEVTATLALAIASKGGSND